MNLPTLGHLRRARLFLKATTVVVTVAFLGLYLQPLALAARLPSAAASSVKTPPTSEEMLSRALEDIEDQLTQLETKLDRRVDAAAEKAGLKTMRQELDALDKQARVNFDAIERHLKDKKLPQAILDRHTEAVRTYRSEMAVLKSNLDSLEIAKDDTERKTRAQKAREHLKLKNTKKARPKFDPNDMPNKSLQPNRKNTPKLKPSDFVRAGLISNPAVKLAALGDFTFDKLPGASDPAYLAATAEVTLTPAIQAKAQELGHNPVKIYHWVRNNIEWLPTWGATQDADVTLGSQRGNAMDIASLLIALLRASGIPARYVHGTIEMPEDKFRNWAGGFTSITAAADYAASGGIPVTTVISGGKITKVQLEHIWVEAAIDFHPSRGAVNKSADSWIQLDPSFKQYQDLQGLDVVAITGIDPNTVAQSFASSGTVNEQEGWVSGLNPAVLQNAQAQAQTVLQTYITNNLPNATVTDIIGGRRIITQTNSVLSSAMPYRSVVVGARYGAIPAALQHTMTFAFGTDLLGEQINPVIFPWPKFNNHKVTLSFKPATAADEQTLASLLPSGQITDLSQLPSSIPSYLIDVIPEVAVDGQVVGQGNTMRLGEILNFYYGIDRVNGQGSHSYTYPVVAGSYLSVAVVGGSVSPMVLNNLRAKLIDTQTKLASDDAALIGALNREDILGDMFQAGTLGYFGQYLALSHIASQPQKARHELPSAYGTLGYEPNVQTLFGFPRAITLGGVAVNVRLQWVIDSLDGDTTKRPQLSLQTGMLSSALEHSVPEQLFSTPDEIAEGVSAAKALQLASQQGQRIYHVTSQNKAQTLSNLHLDSLAMNEITQALAVGKEVIAHTDRISISGWTGEGYILFDPITGDGAYKITGGNNGGFLKTALMKLQFYAGWWLSFAKNHPAIAKAISGSIGYFLATIPLLIDTFERCKDVGFAVLITTVLLLYNIAVLLLTVALAASGVGFLALFALSAVEYFLERELRDYLIQTTSACR
ncbi:MAG: transglutaminase-like domain-containing protein [Sulfuricaulis sp.]